MEPVHPDNRNIRIRITGLVQGIGFRPHVYRTATARNITGTVENRTDGVVIHARGTARDLESFLEDLRYRNLPPAAAIESFEVTPETNRHFADFAIAGSNAEGDAVTRISPDLAVCPDCLADMRKQPHRIRYPFINCTCCGPRFSIVSDVPYDRSRTTMADFEMCGTCRAEYSDISDRRYHAQPVACTRCGPSYRIDTGSGFLRDIDEILRAAADCIDGGGIAGVMGMGGYHLACDGTDREAVSLLRRRKNRDARPFALMMRDLETIRDYTRLSTDEETLLTSPARPIVLLKKNGEPLPAGIGDGLDTVGVMLPYLPFHYLLFGAVRTRVLVMTSGNRSDEPIVVSPEQAESGLRGIADILVSHDRRIRNRVDDSVAFSLEGMTHVIRRSRGWVPDPVPTRLAVEGIAALGGELKNTFALGRSSGIVLSQHIGDLDNAETLEFFEESFERFRRLLRFEPKCFVHDAHPDYLSTEMSRKMGAAMDLPVFAVQHHRAHIASVMVEHGLTEPVIGVCYDGTGFGDDGTVWGGEFFTGGLRELRREYHLDPVGLPGGDLAAREPWRMALSCLHHARGTDARSLPLPLFSELETNEGPAAADRILTMLEKQINTPAASSMGRLFDAVSALAGICLVNRYEGEAPMRLESAADTREEDRYSWGLEKTAIDIRPLVADIVDDVLRGAAPGTIAARFMNTVAGFTVDTARRLHERTGIRTVALSGGVFQNRYLLAACRKHLESEGLTVCTNVRVPANDGGLSLGQVGLGAVLQ